MTTSDKLTYLNTTKGLIKEAIEQKGVSVGDVTFRSYADKIAEIKTDITYAWQRPSDRPDAYFFNDDFTSVSLNNNEAWFLFGISPSVSNYFVQKISVSTGQVKYTIAVGTEYETDVLVNTNTIYTTDLLWDNFANIPVSDSGHKLIWIRAIPNTSGALLNTLVTEITPNGATTTGNSFIPNIFEFYCKNLSSLTFPTTTSGVGIWAQCEAVSIEGYRGTTLNNAFYAWRVLEHIYNFIAPNVSTVGDFMYNCNLYNEVFKDNILDRIFAYSSSILLYGFKYNKQYPAMITRFSSPPTSLFCYEGIFEFDLAGKTNSYLTLNTCPKVSGLRIYNMPSQMTNVGFNSATPLYNLTRSAIVNLFNDLRDRTSLTAGTVTLTGSMHYAALSDEEKAIATNKNWSVVV